MSKLKRGSIARFVALFLALAILAGCGSKPTDSPQPVQPAPTQPQQPAGPQRGGTFAMPIISNPAMWPLAGSLPNIIPNKALYSGLVKYSDPDIKPVGDLAESWSLGADGLTWTFKLKKNAKWHDGTPFTADDVLFTVNDLWLNTKVSFFLRSNFSFLDRAEKVDEHTVNLITKTPAPHLPTMLAYLAQMLPKHILGTWTPEQLSKPAEFTKNPIGTGAFKFKEFVPGSHLRLEAFDDFYDGRPNVDAVLFKVIADLEQQLAQLQSGQLDFVPVEPHQVSAVANDPNIRIAEANQVNYFYVAFNNKLAPFNDKQVRQALTMAVDRDAIIASTIGGKGKPANGPISPLLGEFYNPKAKFWPFDKAQAEALLDEAGWVKGAGGVRFKDGQPLKVVLEIDAGNPVREQTAVIVQDAWKAVGVDASIKSSDFNALLTRVRAGEKADAQAYIMWYITAADPDIYSMWATGQSTNTFHYSNPEVDKLLLAGRQETNQAERVKIYHEVQRLIAEDAPIIFLYYPAELHAVSTKMQGWPSIGYRDVLVHPTKFWKLP